MVMRGKKFKNITRIRNVGGDRDDWRFLGMLLPGGDSGKTIRVCSSFRGGEWVSGLEGNL